MSVKTVKHGQLFQRSLTLPCGVCPSHFHLLACPVITTSAEKPLVYRVKLTGSLFISAEIAKYTKYKTELKSYVKM